MNASNDKDAPPQLTLKVTWLGILNYLGAILTSGWALYLTYLGSGALYTLLGLLVLGAILRFGASPLFALSASILYFHFHAGGLWLPLLSYVAAGLAFRKDLQVYRERQPESQNRG